MDEEERAAIQEWREQAKKELNDWYDRRNEQLGKTQSSNRYETYLMHNLSFNIVFPLTAQPFQYFKSL